MMLQETKASKVRLKSIITSIWLGYEVMEEDARGSARGLVVLQNPSEILFDNQVSMHFTLLGHFIHIGTRDWALLSNFYGTHIQGEKDDFLQIIGKLRNICLDELWIIGGDLKLITSLEEKKRRYQTPRFEDVDLSRSDFKPEIGRYSHQQWHSYVE